MSTCNKIRNRINQSRWIQVYILFACLQGIIIIGLQSTIAYYNTAQLNKGFESKSIQSYNLDSDETFDLNFAIDRLKRIKWENIAFIGFQVWFVGMTFDAAVYQNTAEVISLAVMNFVCAIFGALEVVDGKRWLRILRDIKFNHNIPLDIRPIHMAFKLEIALSSCVTALAIGFAYLSYAVVKEFGWKTYKKIGADISIQRMYRTLQFFVLALKIDIFVQFLVSVFYLIQFSLKQGFKKWTVFVFLVITVLLLPMLYFGRYAVANENRFQMILFILFQLCVMFQLILIAVEAMQPGDYWYIWICFVILGMILALTTSVLSFVCMLNFGKGLKPYIQRGDNKEKVDMAQKDSNDGPWTIDDD